MLKEPCKDYGFIIQFLREGKSLSVSELACMTRTTPVFIENTEKSKVHPSQPYIETLASALGVSYNELWERIWCDDPEQCRYR